MFLKLSKHYLPLKKLGPVETFGPSANHADGGLRVHCNGVLVIIDDPADVQAVLEYLEANDYAALKRMADAEEQRYQEMRGSFRQSMRLMEDEPAEREPVEATKPEPEAVQESPATPEAPTE